MKKKIAYLNKDFAKSSKEIIQVKWYSEEVETGHTKHYSNSFALKAKLGPLARLLLDYICERMDDNNIIVNTQKLKDDFNAALLRIKKKSTPRIV